MKVVFLTISLLTVHLGLCQLTVKPILKNKTESDLRGRKGYRTKLVNPATLPFWDDFSITQNSPDSIRIWGNDTTLQWNHELSQDVFVNSTLAINPPSYRVATFDGLDVNGAFHTSPNPWADQLVSDTIDLQGRVNVVLSFYWQGGGNVELPEEGDSLRLQFYDPAIPEADKWLTQWAVDGSDIVNGRDTLFTQVAVPVEGRFLTQDFQFRFQSFGDKNGPFDAWHLDWIYLNENRNDDDLYYDGEININSDIELFINPFKAIPFNQINENDFISSISTSVMNLGPPGAIDGIGPSITNTLTITEIETGNVISSNTPLSFVDPVNFVVNFVNQNPLEITAVNRLNTFNLNLQDLTARDSVVIELKVTLVRENTGGSEVDFLDESIVDLRINDSITTRYLIHDHYAFDDGTAEFAIGTNINGGQVAAQFWLEEPDTLTHVDIYFPNIDPSSSGRQLTLKVFENLDGGDPVRSQQINIENGTEIDEFTRYQLQFPVLLTDTFFVAYQQNINEYIGVGFDRSNPEASKYIFENRSGQWERNESLSGAIMIRPVFTSSVLLPTNVQKVEALKVYPNPTSGILKIEGVYESISIVDFSGKKWMEEPSKPAHDLRGLSQGLYLLTIKKREGSQTLKIIKQ